MGGARQGRREPSYSVDTGAAERVANYHSAIGNLVAILTLTAYLNWSSVIFLTGVELDQLARQGAGSGEPTLRSVLRIRHRSASGGGVRQRSRRPKSRTL